MAGQGPKSTCLKFKLTHYPGFGMRHNELDGPLRMKLLLSLLLASLTASAGEYVVLTNGFRIHADSHVADGPTVRLTTSQGVIELQANTVSAFETVEYTPPPPPAPVQAAPFAFRVPQ